MIPRGVETALVIHDKPDGDLWVGQGDLFHEICHVCPFRGLRLQKFPSGRCVEKEVPGDKCGSVRRADLLKAFLLAAFDPVSGSREAARGLCDQFHLGDGRDTGKCLATESKGRDREQIFRCPDLTGGVAKKR